MTYNTPPTLSPPRNGPSSIVRGNDDWSSLLENMDIPQKLKIDPPYDATVLLLGMYPGGSKKMQQKHLLHYIHCVTIQNSQNLEAIQTPLKDGYIIKHCTES